MDKTQCQGQAFLLPVFCGDNSVSRACLFTNVAGFAAAGLWQHFRSRLGEEARLEAAHIIDFFARAGPNFGNICGDACKDALNIDGFELPEPFRSRWFDSDEEDDRGRFEQSA